MKFRTSRMATLAIPLIALLGAAAASPVRAQTHTATQTEGEDPHAPVYVVASRATYLAGLQEVASDGLARRDSQGNALVIAKLRTHQVGDLSRHVHEKENRCGGFFAFDSLADAEAFVRNDRSAQAMQAGSFAHALLAAPIDNGATVNPWLGNVDAARIKTTISTLSAYTNRYYASTTGRTSAE